MDKRLIYCAGSTGAAGFAAAYLRSLGLPIADAPGEHVGHLLLDVPSFNPAGRLRDGGRIELLLNTLPGNITVYGGNLNHPALDGRQTADFLQDGEYLAQNAYITAECALDVALPYLDITLRDCPTLIIGWGRIGKCLGRLLGDIGTDVTIAARKASDRAMLRALGYHAADPEALAESLPHYRLIYNTVPAPVLTRKQMAACRPDCVKIELASQNGMEDEDVIIARGLPGLHMPESSGELIAKTFLRLYRKEASL